MLYQPPISPAIPPHIGQLIPRIRIAIQDIDVFQNMVAQGVIDSSMPSWYVRDSLGSTISPASQSY